MHDRTLDPKLIHSHRAGTRPCAWPRASASPPELPRSASNWHLPHHSAPRAVQHLSSTARRRSTLDCTASLRGSSRARLSMHLSAPLHSAHGTAQYALRGSLCSAQRLPCTRGLWIGARTESPGDRLRQGARLPERPLFCSAAQARVRLQRSRGWRSKRASSAGRETWLRLGRSLRR